MGFGHGSLDEPQTGGNSGPVERACRTQGHGGDTCLKASSKSFAEQGAEIGGGERTVDQQRLVFKE